MSAVGILDAAYVVFYHPLDNFTEYTQGQVWTGSGGFVPGKIGSAESAVTADVVSIATSQVVATGDTVSYTPAGLAALDSSRLVAAYTKSGAPSKAYSRVVTVSGTAFTVGPEFEVAPSVDQTTAANRVTALTSTLVVYCYHNGVTLAAKAGAVSGNDITLGAEVGVGEGLWNGFNQDVVALDSTTFVITSTRSGIGGGNRDCTAIAGSVSGTAITLGVAKTVESIPATGTSTAAGAIDSTRLLVAYVNTGALGASVFCRIATVSGLDITVGPAFTAAPSDAGVWSVVRLTSTTLVILFNDSTPPRHRAVVATVSGADLTFGAVASRAGVSGTAHIRGSRLSATTFVDSEDNATVAIGTVSGTTVTYGGTTSISALGSFYDVAALAADKLFAVGFDATNEEGAVGTLDTVASLTAPTPGAYPTAVGATRVAAAMWAKKLTGAASTVTVERGYRIDMTPTTVSLGGTTAVWSGAGIAALMTSLNSGAGEAAKHLLVMDFENTSGTTWRLRTSLDGLPWVDQGLQTSGSQVVATTNTAPKLAIAAGEAGQWVDELVLWVGDKAAFALFASDELANLQDLADVFGAPMNQYEEYFGAPICWQATARMPDGSAWRDSGCGPCPPVVRVPRGASDVVVTDDGLAASPRIVEG
jgi:hypothetical protein